MSITIPTELQPFRIPNFVLEKSQVRPRQEGFVETRSHALADLDVSVLSRLCDQFRKDIFEKAGKVDPRLVAVTGPDIRVGGDNYGSEF